MTHDVPEPEQVGPEQVGPEQVGPEQVGPEQVGPEQVGPEQVGPEQVGPERRRTDPVPAEPIAPAESTIRRGPGVIPPFVAPPREGVKRRRWVGIGLGVGIAVLCCGGGGAAFVGLVVTIGNQRISDATGVVTNYMDDKAAGHYASAYQLLCEDLKDQYTLTEFTSEVIGAPILDFVVDRPIRDGSALAVPVSVDYVSGDRDSVNYQVIVDPDGSSRVCGSSRF